MEREWVIRLDLTSHTEETIKLADKQKKGDYTHLRIIP